MNIEVIYSMERKTWNVYVNNEWYFEGTFEQCQDVAINCQLGLLMGDDMVCPGYEEY